MKILFFSVTVLALMNVSFAAETSTECHMMKEDNQRDSKKIVEVKSISTRSKSATHSVSGQ
jgi:hypothetical protein